MSTSPSRTQTNGALVFEFAEFQQEILSISKLAKAFLHHSAPPVLDALRTDLTSIQTSATSHPSQWGIKEGWPLYTKESIGYEPGNEGGTPLFAEITSIWDVLAGTRERRRTPSREFQIVGKASTRVRIVEGSPDEQGAEVAMWRMEIADIAAPGCHFHTQILGRETDTVFPKRLPIPRLPGYVPTPAAVLEFVLGELFQDEWAFKVAASGDVMNQWRPIQKKRFERLLNWQLDQVGRSMGSPWIALKKTKPAPRLFL